MLFSVQRFNVNIISKSNKRNFFIVESANSDLLYISKNNKQDLKN